MSGRPIAYVMEQTLGSITHYLNLRREEAVAGEVRPRWLPVEFEHGPLPWAFTGSLIARRAITPLLDEVDGLFFHTTTIAMLSADHFRKKPAVLSSDGTPLNKRGMREAYGLRPEGRFAERAKRALYRRIFERAAGFVAWSNWTKASYVEDYGCPDSSVAVIPPGIDLTDFVPGDRAHEIPRILFVGGDFKRKGGDLLLEVFRARLRGHATLVLVTRDLVPDEPGVTVYRNVSANSLKLRELYATCDVFALPTRADCYSLVCMEALAAGMPLVTTRVGGLSDMVKEGETGHVVARDDAAALGDALEALVVDRAMRNRMAKSCRAEAERRFDARTNARLLFDFVRSRC